jgi:hypothetical protein
MVSPRAALGGVTAPWRSDPRASAQPPQTRVSEGLPPIYMYLQNAIQSSNSSNIYFPTMAAWQKMDIDTVNNSLPGFDLVDSVKANIEAPYLNIVSSADVLTQLAHDAVVLAKGPF